MRPVSWRVLARSGVARAIFSALVIALPAVLNLPNGNKKEEVMSIPEEVIPRVER